MIVPCSSFRFKIPEYTVDTVETNGYNARRKIERKGIKKVPRVGSRGLVPLFFFCKEHKMKLFFNPVFQTPVKISVPGKWYDLDDFHYSWDFKEECESYVEGILEGTEDEGAKYELNFPQGEFDEDWEKSLFDSMNGKLPEEWWEIKDELEKSGLPPDVFTAWLDNSRETPTQDNADEAGRCYIGDMTPADYARESFEQTGDFDDIPKVILRNIDWDGVGRELVDSGEIYEVDGHLFKEGCFA